MVVRRAPILGGNAIASRLHKKTYNENIKFGSLPEIVGNSTLLDAKVFSFLFFFFLLYFFYCQYLSFKNDQYLNCILCNLLFSPGVAQFGQAVSNFLLHCGSLFLAIIFEQVILNYALRIFNKQTS